MCGALLGFIRTRGAGTVRGGFWARLGRSLRIGEGGVLVTI